MRRQGGEDKAEVGESFGQTCTLSESDQRTLLLLRLRIWDLPKRRARQPSKPSAKPSTETQPRVRSQPTTTTKRGRRRVIREHCHPERVRCPLCVGDLRPQSIGRVKSRSESAPQPSRQRLLRIKRTKSSGLCVQPRSSKGGTKPVRLVLVSQVEI